jgi:quercetin dioxygenase-like cupin family protein
MKKNIRASTVAAIGLAILSLSGRAVAQSGTNRVELQRHDLSVSGREVVQAVVNIRKGQAFPKHKHPGEEIIYVLQGILEYTIGDNPPVILKAGEVLFVPYGVVHSVKNAGDNDAAELATYIVEKGKPLVELVR